MTSLWDELRRRQVVRAVLAYVVVAAGIGGAADVFLPGLGARFARIWPEGPARDSSA